MLLCEEILILVINGSLFYVLHRSRMNLKYSQIIHEIKLTNSREAKLEKKMHLLQLNSGTQCF